MRAHIYKFAFCFILTSLSAGTASAWDSFGHMMVASVAYDDLTPAARTKAVQLVKLNPDYKVWIKGVAKANQNKTAFVMAATWPDAIKSKKTYTNDGEHPTNPNAAANIGYSDKLMHRYWHYIDEPFSPDGTPLAQPQLPNAQTQIAEFRKTLALSGATNKLKSYDLVWILHLVGDVHQPLHATSRFTHDLPQGDSGGNLVKLCAMPCKNELHAYWDNILGTSKSPTSAIKKATALPAPDATLAAENDESQWIQESFAIAKQSVYASPIGVGAGPFTTDPAYKAAAVTIADQQIALAGARLAKLLNLALQ
ncbi:MAG TPA: S1/P1 nuclease [Steroidobacteraceae bacterium]|nr:S1/P1 nuclease [Steroidobacteraceae bacterium]